MYCSTSNNQYTYEYFTQDYVCRICWSEDGVAELSSFTDKNEGKPLTIAEKITELTGIDTALGFPRRICKKCLDKVESFIAFKVLCWEKEKILTDIIQKGPIIKKDELADSDYNDSNFEIIEYEEDTGSTDILIKKIESEFKYFCMFCKKGFITNRKLQNHYTKNHHFYDNSRNENRVKRSHIKKKTPTYCTICKNDYLTKEKLTDHNSEVHHIINNLFNCFGCEKKFLLRHQRFRHEKFYCKGLKQGFHCKKCDRLLPSRKIWQQHYLAHQSKKKILVPENVFQCRLCEKAFLNMQLLHEHRKSHNKKQDNKYVCDECGREFARRDYFSKHQKIHSGLKPYKCSHCDFRALQKSTLNAHLRKHTGERPYACKTCDMKFSTSSNLTKHVRTHLGFKKFECQLCNKKFSYKQSLEEHHAAIHNQDTFTCEHCPTTYVSFRGLKRHLAQKHDKKIDKKTFKHQPLT